MKHIVLLISLSVLLGACTTTPATAKHAISSDTLRDLDKTDFILIENNYGVIANWIRTERVRDGNLETSLDFIRTSIKRRLDISDNASESYRSKRAANFVGGLIEPDTITASFLRIIDEEKQKPIPASYGIQIGDIFSRQRFIDPDTINDAIEIETTYTLSPDRSTLQVVGYVSYTNPEIAAAYDLEASEESASPILYRNAFIYRSKQLPEPELTDAAKTKLPGLIRASFVDGGRQAGRRMRRELKAADDNTLSDSEASLLMLEQWAANDAALLLREVQAAQRFIVHHALNDVNKPALDRVNGLTIVLDEVEKGRSVRIIGTGQVAGTYISTHGELDNLLEYGHDIEVSGNLVEHFETIQSELEDPAS